MPLPPRNAICLVFDGLQAGYLGPYGNAWLSTPHCNRLASESILADFAFLDTPCLERLCRSYWTGVHAACPVSAAGSCSQSLASRLEAVGVDTVLVTDAQTVAEHPLAWDFGDRLFAECPAASIRPEPAETIEDTALARFLARVLDRVGEMTEPFLMWVHCGALGRAWDAPLSLRRELIAGELEDESGPGESAALFETVPPHGSLRDDSDPDELFALRRAYAAQIQVLDTCLGALLQALAEAALDSRTLFVVAGARGFPLGEHGRLGWSEVDLHEELIHIPWLMRFPDQFGASTRLSALVQPPDLPATLAEWFGLPGETASRSMSLGLDLGPLLRGEADSLRDRILIVGEGQRLALRTPAWLLKRPEPATTANDRVELFAKPDDRWEVNEVHNRCPTVAAELEERLDELAAFLESARWGQLTPLSDTARDGLR